MKGKSLINVLLMIIKPRSLSKLAWSEAGDMLHLLVLVNVTDILNKLCLTNRHQCSWNDCSCNTWYVLIVECKIKKRIMLNRYILPHSPEAWTQKQLHSGICLLFYWLYQTLRLLLVFVYKLVYRSKVDLFPLVLPLVKNLSKVQVKQLFGNNNCIYCMQICIFHLVTLVSSMLKVFNHFIFKIVPQVHDIY